MSIDLGELEQLAKDASPGPWYAKATDDDVFMSVCYVSLTPGRFAHDQKRSMQEPSVIHEEVVAITLLQSPRLADVADEKWDENTHYIAAVSPDVVLELIAEVRRLRELVDNLTEEDVYVASPYPPELATRINEKIARGERWPGPSLATTKYAYRCPIHDIEYWSGYRCPYADMNGTCSRV